MIISQLHIHFCKWIITISLLVLHTNIAFSQSVKGDTTNFSKQLKFEKKALIIPSVLISYGVIGIESEALKFYNNGIREEVQEHIDERASIDDLSQYSPALAVYALNSLGIKGRNNFGNRTTILATSYLLMGLSVNSIKNLTRVERPDGSAKNSFPSGHTATAFMGAEFLWQEYKNVSPWYGIAGYVVAGGTGAFRIYNNRHWLTDVVAGAGIGILSTKIAYWINPVFKNKGLKENYSYNNSYLISPFYNGQQVGMSLSITL